MRTITGDSSGYVSRLSQSSPIAQRRADSFPLTIPHSKSSYGPRLSGPREQEEHRVKENMGHFGFEFIAGGWDKGGPLVILNFQPFGVDGGDAVCASEHLVTEREVDDRISEIKGSLDAAAALAKAALRR